MTLWPCLVGERASPTCVQPWRSCVNRVAMGDRVWWWLGAGCGKSRGVAGANPDSTLAEMSETSILQPRLR